MMSSSHTVRPAATLSAAGIVGWGQDQLREEIERRGRAALEAVALPVDYYRIGYRLVWPLPIDTRPDRFPAELPGMPQYPWLTWIGWGLEERWAALRNLARLGGDGSDRAATLLAAELGRLAGWSSFVADDGRAGLITASIALGLIRALETDTLGSADRARLIETSARLVEESLLPRFRREREDPPEDEIATLHNIRLIPLFTGGRLAALIDHPGLDAVRDLADDAVRLWLDARSRGYTEGVAYDAYLIEHLLNWLAVSPDPDARAEIVAAARGWTSTTIPGRPGAQAPLGDIEPEMTQWLTVITAAGDDELGAWCRTVPLAGLPSAALSSLLPGPIDREPAGPVSGGRQPAAVTLRGMITDGSAEDDQVLVAVSTPRVEIGHLHLDSGQVVVAWRGTCWITDPGYQQYRAGEERDFTLGEQAHNVPVIGAAIQTRRRPVIAATDTDRVLLDLTDCYPIEHTGLSVRREVRLIDNVVIIRDQLDRLPADTTIRTHWQMAGEVSWQFVDGWARLSVDHGIVPAAVWFGRAGATLEPAGLSRHAGSRGALTLTVETPTGHTDWILVLDPAGGWTPPSTTLATEFLGTPGHPSGALPR